jgi:hypothetical protein
VAGRLSAAQLVVVHGGQVVMNQRIGVDHLDGGCQREDGGGVAPERLGGGERQHRANALAAGQQ